MKLIYFGAGAFGLPTLQALHASLDHEVIAVVSQPDKPAGRKRVLTPTPIAQWSAEQGIDTLKSDDVNTPEFVAQISALSPDASVVIAFGQKLSPELLGAMGRLAINVHSSLLPKYRGAAPINWAMIENEAVTGVSVIGLAQKMDAGEIYATAETPIDPNETAGELHDRLAELGPGCVAKVLDDLANDTLSPIVQDHTLATKARKFTKADGTVDFNQPGARVRSRIHGLTPWPGCRVVWRSDSTGEEQTLMLRRVSDHPSTKDSQAPGTVLNNLAIACESGSIELLEVQAPGGKAMAFAEFLKGHGIKPGDKLSPLS
ncbi:methionyl-tRNA formyltransferase [Algisphaera agarilytica]|uniref:Methionyl-tRNA formyltransferase n=1 Tax=Algisphaera agarilytica TaxID=1385975 RepID=A0A7X0HB64_9BACT|nr:methionyl-tRNA formyltransferase [Algisphaera agarilytica]MBB6431184.1 methionyl-tRNA formyltransferase [Algisphaera agarilytica]